MSDKTQVQYMDRVEDLAESVDKLAKAVARQPAPVVNVAAPATSPVKCEPVINLPEPVTHVHNERPAADYEVRDIRRDQSGFLTGFRIITLKP